MGKGARRRERARPETINDGGTSAVVCAISCVMICRKIMRIVTYSQPELRRRDRKNITEVLCRGKADAGDQAGPHVNSL
jgi:hypothetical protein